MIDLKYLVRAAYYKLLNGFLTSGGNPVVVSDTIDANTDAADIYVLLISENSSTDNTHQSFQSVELIRVDILARGTYVSTKVVDDIASQILQLVLPIPQSNGLGNSKIINCFVTDDRYQPFRDAGRINVARRMITFSQLVAQ